MISYRELAMRVVGKPLHVSSGKPVPAAHRVMALALTAAMVASLSAPAFAGWNIDMSAVKGDVTITKTDSGTTVKVGNIAVDENGTDGISYTSDDDKITVTGSNVRNGVDDGNGSGDQNSNNNGSIGGQSDNSGDAVTQEAREDSAPVVAGDTADEMTYTDPTPVETAPDVSEDKADSEEKAEDEIDPEEKTEEETEGEAEGAVEGADGETTGEPAAQPAADVPATLEAPAAAVAVGGKSKDDDSKAVTYESNSFTQKVADTFSSAAKYVLSIINRSNSTLDVTLNNTTIDATGTNKNALTVSGSGDTKLTLVGGNTLTGDTSKAGLMNNSDGTLTITGSEEDTLTASGYNGIQGSVTVEGGDVTATGGVDSKGAGAGISGTTVKVTGGTVKATGGKNTSTDVNYGMGGYGIVSGAITIEGGSVTATGGEGKQGGVGIVNTGALTITGTAQVTAQGGKGTTGKGGSGIRGAFSSTTSIEGGTVTVQGGSSEKSYGGDGISLADSRGSTLNITGGNTTINKSEGGKAISGDRAGNIDPSSVISGDATLTVKDSKGNTVYPEPPRADSDSDTPEAPVPADTEKAPVGVAGFRFTNPFGGEITVHTEVKDGAITFTTHHYGATMHTTVGALRQLREQGVTQITFQTLLHATTLSLDDLLAADDVDSAKVLLTHDGKKATLTVNGVER